MNTGANIVTCPYCDRGFKNTRALGVHRASQHPVENNELIVTERVKVRWNIEHLRMLAAAEARAPATIKFMNQYLVENGGTGRNLESIKKQRQKAEYKRLVEEFRQGQGNDFSPPVQVIPTGQGNAAEKTTLPEAHCNGDEAFNDQIEEHVENGRVNLKEQLELDLRVLRNNLAIKGVKHLARAVEKALSGEDTEPHLEQWLRTAFPQLQQARNHRNGSPMEPQVLSRRKQRQRDYQEVQKLWRKNMSKAAGKVLDGDSSSGPHPDLDTQERFWRPIFEERNPTIRSEGAPAKHFFEEICSPLTLEELKSNKPGSKSAAGPDGLRASDWVNGVADWVKMTIFHIFQHTGRVPAQWRNSRTILIPKESGTMDPAKFRPISIASVILRHYHKVLSSRLLDLPLLDKRQRAFIKADGLADNVFVLSATIADARVRMKELHVAAIDVRKAFDTVSHEAIERVMNGKGLPSRFVNYVMNMYRTSSTVIEVNGETSQPIFPGQGVRQGDPLSSFIFNLIIDDVLKQIPAECGYVLNGRLINALAFADDLVIIASSTQGLQMILDRVVTCLAQHGLQPMPSKCRSMSLVPSGREKKMKIITEPTFTIAGANITQMGVNDTWNHLGVSFGHRGPTAPAVEMEDLLERVTKAPLKPQQRLTILRVFLIPRFIHRLVFGISTHGMLRRLDKTVRKSVRTWLFLPKDIPTAFIHTSIQEGGLGVMSFESRIPEMTRTRLQNLTLSDFPVAREIPTHEWGISRLKWCDLAKIKNNQWARKLYSSVDGKELREARQSQLSTSWVSDPFVIIPAREYVQNVRTRINALPSRMRTTRGARRVSQPVMCRAECGEQETTAHIIQRCLRTHGGRVLRHDAIVNRTSELLTNCGYKVEREKRYETSEGARKPDIVAAKDGQVSIIDVQIVSGGPPLRELHAAKRQKYANNGDLIRSIAQRFHCEPSNVAVSTVTITWRGIWCGESDKDLCSLGLSRKSLRGLTTRVLQGSHINFNRFNSMTTVARHGVWPWRRRAARSLPRDLGTPTC
uniref:Reverse transcriptase domain-containing protein n=1 Tax=Bracon brevicornis TaxID=1563983 RepID=A0A6V7KNY1_9HYME